MNQATSAPAAFVPTQVFQTPDGVIHATKKAANDHMRRPAKTAALNKVTGDNAELTSWLIDNEDAIEEIFESTRVRRVKLSERKALEKALDAITKSGDKAFAFVIENAADIVGSFKWPTVKKGSEEEQAATIRNGFMLLTSDNAALSDWIIAKRDEILDGFQAGVVKQQISEKALQGLAKYKAEQAAKKAAEAAAAGEVVAASEVVEATQPE